MSSGVWMSSNSARLSSAPATVTAMPIAPISSAPVAMARFIRASSPAPKQRAITTDMPLVMPISRPRSSCVTGDAAPTAASASGPTPRPTTAVSTMLYSCWNRLPIMIGRANAKIIRQMPPCVMSTDFEGSPNFRASDEMCRMPALLSGRSYAFLIKQPNSHAIFSAVTLPRSVAAEDLLRSVRHFNCE